MRCICRYGITRYGNEKSSVSSLSRCRAAQAVTLLDALLNSQAPNQMSGPAAVQQHDCAKRDYLQDPATLTGHAER